MIGLDVAPLLSSLLPPFQGVESITGDEGTHPSLGAGLNCCAEVESFKSAIRPAHVVYFKASKQVHFKAFGRSISCFLQCLSLVELTRRLLMKPWTNNPPVLVMHWDPSFGASYPSKSKRAVRGTERCVLFPSVSLTVEWAAGRRGCCRSRRRRPSPCQR